LYAGDASSAAADRFSAAESAFAAYSRDFGSARSRGPRLRGLWLSAPNSADSAPAGQAAACWRDRLLILGLSVSRNKKQNQLSSCLLSFEVPAPQNSPNSHISAQMPALARGAPRRQKPWGGPGLGTTVDAATLQGRARERLPSVRRARACEGAHHRASALGSGLTSTLDPPRCAKGPCPFVW
jgi:hypothetical protein